MWAALFGSTGEGGVLVLKPDASAIAAGIAGFRSGAEVRLTTDATHKTVGALLDKLNKYRGPDQQLRRVWRGVGSEEVIVGSEEEVRGTVVAIVRAASTIA